ncbi:MAG: hypothetical protein Q9217_003115 [Psora testacea]
MGSSTSRPSPPKEHVFTAETPIRFSPDLLQSLAQSPESDNTRASDLELHIQRRVADELRRLDAETTTSIKKLEDEISSVPDEITSTNDPTALADRQNQLSASGEVDHPAKDHGDKTRELSRAKVQEEIDTLKKKLQERKMREDVVGDKEVEKAKKKVVQCLRVNDRRPLDCWKEVEGFKREVGRLEQRFLAKVVE